MIERLRFARAWLVAIVLLLLACSPQAIVREVLGENETRTPTTRATSFARAITETATSAPSATRSVAGMDTPTPGATATVGATPTRPPALQLRTDLPALALRDFPRPANDNGRCFHFLTRGYYSPRDFEIQIARLKGLQARWVLALYADENQLRLAAREFKAAGIVPVWRKTLRAHQRYLGWGRDIAILNEIGLPPYFQIYNEPEVEEEWDGNTINREQWIANFIQAARDVYNAGGYPGLQVLDDEWGLAVIREIKARQGERMFGRMFFVPHPYGANHPPSWNQDEIGVLGFQFAARVFQSEIGFVPPFIAGEGGWKYKSDEDKRFPVVDDAIHAKYHVEVFNWFLTGKLSDGAALPDYLFAFCPWLLSGETETAAWYDSFEGNRELTIAEVKKLTPAATRKFSWDKK